MKANNGKIHRKQSVINPLREPTRLEKRIQEQVDVIWDIYDTDKSGALDKHQTSKFVKDTLRNLRPNEKFSDEIFGEVFTKFDKDQSGHVERGEMFAFIKHVLIGFDQEEMELEDLRIGELEPILERLEDIGAEFKVQKYQEMLELRSHRINKVNKELDIHSLRDMSIIDSSHVQGATVITAWFKAFKNRKVVLHFRQLSRDSLSLTSPRNEILKCNVKDSINKD